MPHIFDLNTSQATELATPGLAPIRARVTLETEVLPVISQLQNGEYLFGANYVPATLDITNRLRNNYISIKNSIPVLPTQDGKANQQGNVTIQIDNTDRYLGVLQNEGILDGNAIQDSILTVHATCGLMDPLPMYKGRVVSSPTEEEGKTTFGTKSILWDIIEVPLVMERSASNDIDPELYINSSNQLIVTPTVIDGVEYHHGIGVFNQYGQIDTGLKNDGSDVVYIDRIDFRRDEDNQEVPLGKFTIRFLSPTQYEVTQPDGLTLIGSPYADFNQGFLTINATSWDIDPNGDPTGTEIEFNTYYTAKGNPWTICKHLLYKALTDTWGDGVLEPTELPVDWDAFSAFERRYPQDIYFCETNAENEVFSTNTGDKPKRIKDILQKILDHVGCQLTFTPEGKVSVVSTLYVSDQFNLRTYTSSHLSSGIERKASHSIFSTGPKFDRMEIRYGLNPVTNDYGSRKVEVIPGKTVDKFNTYSVSLDYFKIGVSDRYVNRLASVLFPMVATANRRLKLSFLPNMGLPIQPGDKFEASFTTQPVLPNVRTNSGRYWMIYNVTVKIGNVVTAEAVEIKEPIEGGQLCESFVLCETRLC